MGSVISTLFGGGMMPSMDVPQVTAAPNRDEIAPVDDAAREAERRKNRARAGGVRSTLLVNSLGGGQNTLGA